MSHTVDSVPDDSELEKWLQEKLQLATVDLLEFLDEYFDVVDFGKENGDPELFAYARLLNRLAELDQPSLIRMLSAYIYPTKREPV